MTAAGEDWKELASTAASLADAKFLMIVDLFEQVRHQPAIAQAMDVLRPRIASLRPPRRITASRLFFLPVEDLLDDVGSYQRKLSRVSRATLPLCWDVVRAAVGERHLSRIEGELKTTDSRATGALVELGQPLWEAGAEALVKALVGAEADQKRRIALFGRDDDVLRQVAVVSEAARIGPLLQSVKSQLPDKPIEVLAEFHGELLRRSIRDLAAEDINKITPFLLVLSARMLRPGDLLAVLAETRLDGQQQEKDRVARDVGVFAVENLLRQSNEVPTLLRGGLGAHDVALMAERLLDGFDSMRPTLQRADQRRLASRVDKARDVISDAIMARVIAPADEELLRPISMLALSARGARSGEAEAPPLESLAQAEDFARAYRRCARIAPMVGLKAELQAKTAEICWSAQQAAGELGQAVEGDRGLDRAMVDSQVVALLRLVEIIAGADQADAILMEWEAQVGLGAGTPAGAKR